MRPLRILAAGIAVAGFGLHSARATPTETVIYSFAGHSDGAFPYNGLIADAHGTLYGTTRGGAAGGTVFRLTPPGAGNPQWTYTVLHRFGRGTDGAGPGGLVLGGDGALYGTTGGGGAEGVGTVYRLAPPTAGRTQWTETVLHSFAFPQVGRDSDGANPNPGLIADATGALYGTTEFGGYSYFGYGTVFRLTPPVAGGTQWTETVLHSFRDRSDGRLPQADLLLDASGALYGTTSVGGNQDQGYGSGTVFSLTPPATGGTRWALTVLHAFSLYGPGGAQPRRGLIADATGALYGTTSFTNRPGESSNSGTVFKLTPPSAGGIHWPLTVLYRPKRTTTVGFSSVLAEIGGEIYGTTDTGGSGSGTVFKLAPPVAGRTRWAGTVLHVFAGAPDGATPYAGLIADSSGALYGTTAYGGAFGLGTVFKVVP